MKILEQIERLVSGKLSIIKMMIDIAKLEARLAELSIYPLLINLCLLLVIFMTTWLAFMLLVGYGLLLALNSLAYAAVSVLVLNLLLLGVLLYYLSFNLKKMSFEKTREFFSSTVGTQHDQLEKANHSETCRDGKKIKVSTSECRGE